MAGANFPDDLFAWLRDLERRLVVLERVSMLGSASIKDGALTIYDGSLGGLVPRAKLGKQDDGSWDIAMFDAAGANPVKLSTLAFALSASQILTEEATSSSTFTDLATVGPSVTTTIGPSGRALVHAFARTTAYTSGVGLAQSEIGIDVSGATTIAPGTPPQSPSITLYVNSRGAVADADTVSAARGLVVTGLNPGPTTFKMKYRGSGPAALTATFGSRVLIVQPF